MLQSRPCRRQRPSYLSPGNFSLRRKSSQQKHGKKQTGGQQQNQLAKIMKGHQQTISLSTLGSVTIRSCEKTAKKDKKQAQANEGEAEGG